MITITLNKIKAHEPGGDLWENLLDHLGKTEADNDEFPLADVLKSNGFEDALWCLSCLPEHDNKWRLLAVKFAREVQHRMGDKRTIKALDVAEKHAKGEATNIELDAAAAAAKDAACDAERETAMYGLAFKSPWAVMYAATAAVCAAAGAGASAAAAAAAWAADAAMDDRAAARQKQEQLFLEAIQ